MNVTYVRGQDKNLLLIENTKEEDSFEYRMFENCTIPGFLEFKTTYRDGKNFLAYNISSLQELDKYYENKEISYDTLHVFLQDILNAFDSSYSHMLSGERIILESKYMYFDIESKHLFLIYYPLYNRTLDESFTSFAEYLLERVDHTDDKAVVLAYKFYKLVKDCNFTINSLRLGLFDSEVKSISDEDKFESSEQDYSCNEQKDDSYLEPVIDNNDLYSPKKETGLFKNLFRKRNIKNIENTIDISTPDIPCNSNLDVISVPTPSIDDNYGKTIFIPQDSSNSCHTLTYILKNKSIVFDLTHFPITIGKLKNEADLVLDDKSISRIHAKITEDKGCLYLEDCNSTNGTYINGMPLDVNDHIMLEHGDEIKLGNFMLVFD